MKNSLSLDQLPKAIASFFKRFHIVIYTLTIVIGVAVAVFLLNGLIAKSSTPDSSDASATTSFDKETIERINNFNTSSSSNDTFTLPSGRINPLVE